MLYFCCFPLHCNEIHVRFLFKRYISSVYNSLFLLRSLVFATVAGCRARESMLKRLFTVIRTTLGVDIYYVISALWALDYRNFYSIAMLDTHKRTSLSNMREFFFSCLLPSATLQMVYQNSRTFPFWWHLCLSRRAHILACTPKETCRTIFPTLTLSGNRFFSNRIY